MEPISGINTSTPQDSATKNVLALNSSMFELYDNSLHIFEKNILAKHPVILALFSGAGGRFILSRPGIARLEIEVLPKGMAEVVMMPVVAALLNAIFDATGHRFQSLPATGDMLKGALA